MVLGSSVLEEEVEARKQVASRLAAGYPALQRRAGEQIPLLQLRTTEQQGRREVGWLHSVSAPQAAPLPGRTKKPDEVNHLRFPRGSPIARGRKNFQHEEELHDVNRKWVNSSGWFCLPGSGAACGAGPEG